MKTGFVDYPGIRRIGKCGDYPKYWEMPIFAFCDFLNGLLNLFTLGYVSFTIGEKISDIICRMRPSLPNNMKEPKPPTRGYILSEIAYDIHISEYYGDDVPVEKKVELLKKFGLTDEDIEQRTEEYMKMWRKDVERESDYQRRKYDDGM